MIKSSKVFSAIRIGLVSLGVMATVSCSEANQQCRAWRSSSDFYATMDSCEKCVAQLGPSNRDAVYGCALTLDATKLMGR